MKKIILALLLCVSSCATASSDECFEALHFLGDGPKGKPTAKRACGDFKKHFSATKADAKILVWWLKRGQGQYLCARGSGNACYEQRGIGKYVVEIRVPYGKDSIWQSEALYHEIMHVLLSEADVKESHHLAMERHRLCPAGHCGKFESSEGFGH